MSREALIRVGGVVLLREDGAALMQLRDNKPGLSAAGQWVFPGGHCEPGESNAVCARRECLEETGYDCVEIKLLTEFEYVSPDSGKKFWMSFWWGRYDGKSPIYCWEGQEMRFVTRAEFIGQPTPDYVPGVWDLALKKLKDR